MRDRYLDMKAALPPSYVEHIEEYNGWEGDLGDILGYVVLWDKETIQERWDDYEMGQYLSDRWFPFGSDGGGEMFCFDLKNGTDAVFWMPYIGMSDEEAMLQDYAFQDLSRAIIGQIA